jgi:SAM-dependent methyltransferase
MARPTSVWDRIFAEHGKVFEQPHEDMAWLLHMLRARGAERLLDLGCGSGRHLLYFAAQGFQVSGLDNAPEGLDLTRSTLAQAGLSADLCQQDMFDPLPYATGAFDALISIQVIHHARIGRVRSLAAEMTRVVHPGGILFVTVPEQQNQGPSFEHVEPGTYIPLDGREAGLPHHYFNPEELQALFDSFEPIDLHVDRDAHYCFTALRRLNQL